MRTYVIIVAGGHGTRMNSATPKQFMKLGDKLVLMHSILKFSDCGLNPEIIVALPRGQQERWEQFCLEYKFNVPIRIADGGETRYGSVKNALGLIEEPGIVAVHDAVCPLVHSKTILAGFRDAGIYGNAVPAIPLSDSIRKVEPGQNCSVDRAGYRVIQTPQCFKTELIIKAYAKEYKTAFTDDASVLESDGGKIHLIEGTAENIKITNPQDLMMAEAILRMEASGVRRSA